MINLTTYTLAELRAEFLRLGNDLSTINSERRLIHAEIEKRVREALATNCVRTLTPMQKEALAEALKR